MIYRGGTSIIDAIDYYNEDLYNCIQGYEEAVVICAAENKVSFLNSRKEHVAGISVFV